MSRDGPLAVVLAAAASLGLLAEALGSDSLRRVAAASGLAPVPRALRAPRGFEPRTARLVLEWRGADGAAHALVLGPRHAAGLRGPGLRRLALLTALSEAPRLAATQEGRDLLAPVLAHAFDEPGELPAELGLEPGPVRPPLRLVLAPRPGPRPELPLELEIPLE